MSVQIINWPENQSREEWLEARRKIQGVGETYTRVSASDIGTITGSSKYKSKRRLFLSMAGLYHKDFITSTLVQGNIAESMVASFAEGFSTESFEDTLRNVSNGVRLQPLKQAKFFLLNDNYPHLSASLDYVPDHDVFSPWTGEKYHPLTSFEMKYINPQAYMQWKTPTTQAYFEQLQIQMGMGETKVSVFNVLRWDGNFNSFEVEFDKDVFEHLSHEAGLFATDVTRAKLLTLQIEQTDDELQKADLYAEIESLVPYDNVDDVVDLTNELHRPSASEKEFKEVENDSEEYLLMSKFCDLKAQESFVAGELNETKARLLNLCNGYDGFIHEDFKGTIRGLNSTKKPYFKVDDKRKLF